VSDRAAQIDAISGIVRWVTALGWYPGSPFVIRTTAIEPAPAAARGGRAAVLRFENVGITNAADVPVLSLYKSVIGWCRQLSVLVTWADLR
jgi:hypothetical protein